MRSMTRFSDVKRIAATPSERVPPGGRRREMAAPQPRPIPARRVFNRPFLRRWPMGSGAGNGPSSVGAGRERAAGGQRHLWAGRRNGTCDSIPSTETDSPDDSRGMNEDGFDPVSALESERL